MRIHIEGKKKQLSLGVEALEIVYIVRLSSHFCVVSKDFGTVVRYQVFLSNINNLQIVLFDPQRPGYNINLHQIVRL